MWFYSLHVVIDRQITIRVISAPFPPADRRPKPKMRSFLAHYPLFDNQCRKKRTSRCAWHAQRFSITFRVRKNDAVNRPPGCPCIMSGDLGVRQIRMNTFFTSLNRKDYSFTLMMPMRMELFHLECIFLFFGWMVCVWRWFRLALCFAILPFSIRIRYILWVCACA